MSRSSPQSWRSLRGVVPHARWYKRAAQAAIHTDCKVRQALSRDCYVPHWESEDNNSIITGNYCVINGRRRRRRSHSERRGWATLPAPRASCTCTTPQPSTLHDSDAQGRQAGRGGTHLSTRRRLARMILGVRPLNWPLAQQFQHVRMVVYHHGTTHCLEPRMSCCSRLGPANAPTGTRTCRRRPIEALTAALPVFVHVAVRRNAGVRRPWQPHEAGNTRSAGATDTTHRSLRLAGCLATPAQSRHSLRGENTQTVNPVHNFRHGAAQSRAQRHQRTQRTT